MKIELEHQEAEPLDDATIAAVNEALESMERGESLNLAETKAYIREKYQEWLKTREQALVR